MKHLYCLGFLPFVLAASNVVLQSIAFFSAAVKLLFPFQNREKKNLATARIAGFILKGIYGEPTHWRQFHLNSPSGPSGNQKESIRKSRSINLSVLLLCLLTSSVVRAQATVNIGELYVSSDTQFSTVSDFNNKGAFINDGESFFYGSIINEKVFDFLDQDGISKLVGNRVQELRGEGETYFNQLLLDNRFGKTPFHLYSEIMIENHLQFKRGILDNRTHGGTINFGADASHSGAANQSFVKGAADKMGSTGFAFPTGDRENYRYASISQGRTDAKHYKAKYYFENSDSLYPHNHKMDIIKTINDTEYWTIEPIDDEGDRLLTLSWDEETTPQLMLDNAEHIRIVRWDEKAQSWVDEGGAVDTFNRTVTAAVSGYGVVTTGFVKHDSNLPCKLEIYNAVTPNSDGFNDVFNIMEEAGADCVERLGVKIFNRWGVEVFGTDNYSSSGTKFNGYSSGRATVGGSSLPAGTYFYVLEMQYRDEDDKPQIFQKSGYLYIN